MEKTDKLTPQEYFDQVKERKQKVTDEMLDRVYENCLTLLNSNIDLTEHGDFRESDYFQTASWISSLLRSNKRIPWTWGDFKEISCASDYGDKNNLFFTGTVESIRKKKDYTKYEDGKFCDKCGKPINRYKWFIFSSKTLCAKCDDDLQLQFNKQHQKNKLKDYPVQLSNRYWTVYLNTRS